MIHDLAGLLACTDPSCLPMRVSEQWPECGGSLYGTYSYGDSAGITPVFPFNDAGASTEIGANVDHSTEIAARTGLPVLAGWASFEV